MDLSQLNTNVTLEEYKDNTCLYDFDLTQDFSSSDPFMNVARSDGISLHLKFAEDLPFFPDTERNKIKKKHFSTSDTDSDLESTYVCDEDDRNSIHSSRSKKVSNQKPWNQEPASAEKDQIEGKPYDIIISDYLKLGKEKISPLPVYIGS
ncbi:uncharacterized protein NPIL_52121 [Nephila pilipes]|uniref:Uncharacterized protein n=1 Tax=Nephila pilipes TaxID=299642 RepID=A0A8X6TP73_NEPPI|nr:uncharacterized protein NPIL_52121 [Nephila pilipes]